jgi:hypothetical protein
LNYLDSTLAVEICLPRAIPPGDLGRSGLNVCGPEAVGPRPTLGEAIENVGHLIGSVTSASAP